MKKISLLLVLSIFLIGCKSYVQVFETKGNNLDINEGAYVYENDSLRITYNFWADKGLMTFYVLNKLDKPIYIDWKKSSYIDNSVKLNYWMDIENTKSVEYNNKYYYNQMNGVASSGIGVNYSKTTKPERITFIPPSSNYNQVKFYIYPYEEYKFGSGASYSKIPLKDNPKKFTELIEENFTIETTPLVFRNFLTFSLSENFEDEFYVDNEFYISSVKTIDSRLFEYTKVDNNIKMGKFSVKDENGRIIKFSDYKKETSFYLRLY